MMANEAQCEWLTLLPLVQLICMLDGQVPGDRWTTEQRFSTSQRDVTVDSFGWYTGIFDVEGDKAHGDISLGDWMSKPQRYNFSLGNWVDDPNLDVLLKTVDRCDAIQDLRGKDDRSVLHAVLRYDVHVQTSLIDARMLVKGASSSQVRDTFQPRMRETGHLT